MKTIKELRGIEKEFFKGYRFALEDVLELIDDNEVVCRCCQDYLKAEIKGEENK